MKTCCRLTSHYQVRVWEDVLGLHEGAGVARVEQVEDTVRIDPHRTVGCNITDGSSVNAGGVDSLCTLCHCGLVQIKN